MRNAGLDEAQAGIKISGRNINNLRYADDTTLVAESEEEIKSPLLKMKEESENKTQHSENKDHGISSHNFTESGLGNSERLYFGGSKITADGDCNHEIIRSLLLERKVMTSLDSMLKSRNITLSPEVHLVKAMVLPVVMHGWEKAMATYSNVLAWRIPGTGEPGGLLSVGSYWVRHNWSDLAAAAACMNVGIGL